MKNEGIRTRAVHAGEAPDPLTGASAPNLVMSTTFTMEEPAGFSINAFEGEIPYIYTRWGNPTIRMLEEKLAALEGTEDCVAFGSGMAATAALMFESLKSGDHLVISDVNYAGTAELARGTLPDYGITVSAVDTTDLAAIEAAIRPNTRMIWIETPANPILRLTDIAAVAAIAKPHGVALAVDSTFATPIATRGAELGADFVVHSLTKYIGGHGDALGGAVLGSRERLEPLRTHALIYLGGVISPFNAWLIARGAATLPIRMRAHEEGALKVAEFLDNHPAVARVNHPGLDSHPQRELAKRQMRNTGGTLSFQVHGDGAALAGRMAKELEIIHYAVSLGHHRSLIYWIDTDAMMESTFKLTGQQLAHYREYAGDGVFRLSVGLEDANDLCSDLAHVLA
ncbi:MAG: PLP-dependent transferase [Gammaproteobacteria bacterium]|nr:PLP-dependent transferase [Gammaproteobacteria bacterium]MYF27483.1 PLP-dependent transferase [Gammaproteobacteria bacterium]MYK46458.1 PLP-dependent transferase [Gammaproteobacteria bacterium]